MPDCLCSTKKSCIKCCSCPLRCHGTFVKHLFQQQLHKPESLALMQPCQPDTFVALLFHVQATSAIAASIEVLLHAPYYTYVAGRQRLRRNKWSLRP